MLHACCLETKCSSGLPQLTPLPSLNLQGLGTVMKSDLSEIPLQLSAVNLTLGKYWDYFTFFNSQHTAKKKREFNTHFVQKYKIRSTPVWFYTPAAAD